MHMQQNVLKHGSSRQVVPYHNIKHHHMNLVDRAQLTLMLMQHHFKYVKYVVYAL